MAKLSAEEKETLRRLREKERAPDAPGMARAINISVDLGDENQVKMAKRYGFLPADDDEEEAPEEEEEEGDETPKRRGYFDN